MEGLGSPEYIHANYHPEISTACCAKVFRPDAGGDSRLPDRDAIRDELSSY
jgi:hypothetical protein